MEVICLVSTLHLLRMRDRSHRSVWRPCAWTQKHALGAFFCVLLRACVECNVVTSTPTLRIVRTRWFCSLFFLVCVCATTPMNTSVGASSTVSYASISFFRFLSLCAQTPTTKTVHYTIHYKSNTHARTTNTHTRTNIQIERRLARKKALRGIVHDGGVPSVV